MALLAPISTSRAAQAWAPRIAFTCVEADAEGLRIALRELFEESFLAEATQNIADTDDIEAIRRMEDDLPARSLSPGYYSRAVYLLDLAAAIECGATYAAADLMRSDVQGLDMLRRAKISFEHDHPNCSGCGKRQFNRHMTECPHCRAKFTGKGN